MKYVREVSAKNNTRTGSLNHTPDDVAAAQECEDLGADSRQFVSSVCWSRRSHVLLAANSQGTLKLLELE